MPSWIDDLRSVAFGAGGAGGGLLTVRWLAGFVGGRMDKRADRLDADTRFIIENLRTELTRLAERQERSEGEIADLREQLTECQRKHAESETKAARLEAMLLATRPGLKLAFPPEDSLPNDMAVMAARLDGGPQ